MFKSLSFIYKTLTQYDSRNDFALTSLLCQAYSAMIAAFAMIEELSKFLEELDKSGQLNEFRKGCR